MLFEVAMAVVAGALGFWVAMVAMGRLLRCPISYRIEYVVPGAIATGDWCEVSSLD